MCNVLYSQFSKLFAFLAIAQISPFVIISLGILVVLLLCFDWKVWLFLSPFFLMTSAMSYYLIKEIIVSVFQKIVVEDDNFEVKKFFSSTSSRFTFKEIANISFEWNRNLRFIIGYGSFRREFGSEISNLTSGQSDRNAGGRNFVIKMRNGSTIRIYEHQFSNSEELFNEIIERTRVAYKT